MKILFLRPLNQHIVFYDTPKNIEESSGHINQPPLGLLYVAACAERGTDCEIAVLDGVAEGITDYSVLEARIREIDPDLVAVQSMTTAFLDTVLTVRCVKRIRGDIPVAVGGIHPTIYPEETLDRLRIPGRGGGLIRRVPQALWRQGSTGSHQGPGF
jgi:radical SAM superfamily enzyme YgiQ (UPF0313 family)